MVILGLIQDTNTMVEGVYQVNTSRNLNEVNNNQADSLCSLIKQVAKEVILLYF